VTQTISLDGPETPKDILEGGTLNRWTLRFDDAALEQSFQFHHLEQSYRMFRLITIFGTICFALLGLAEWVLMAEYLNIALLIRYGFCLPVLVCMLYLTRPSRPGSSRQARVALIVAVIAAAAGSLAMYLVAPYPSSLFYAGLLIPMICFMNGHMGVQFVSTAMADIGLLAVFLALTVIKVGPSDWNYFLALDTTAVLTCAAVLLTAYNHEIIIRRGFRDKILLERQSAESIKIIERAEEAESKLRDTLVGEVEKSTAFQQSVLENITEALVAFDRLGRVTLANKQFLELTKLPPEICAPGIPMETMVRRLVQDAGITPEEQEQNVEIILALAHSPGGHSYAYTPPDDVAIEIRTSPMPDGGLVITLVQAMERRRTERQLIQYQKMESLGNLAGGMAHNLNNLLLPIISLSRRAMGENPEGKQLEYLDKVVQAGERAQDLVEQIVVFSREEEEVGIVPFDLYETVRETMILMNSTVPSTVKVNKDIVESVGFILGNPAKIASVLINLVSNAVDAMHGKAGELEVSLKRVEVEGNGIDDSHLEITPGTYACLQVADTGQGMDDATLARIFDPFYTTKEVGQGTGLGLSTAYATVKRQGGTITVTSNPGIGSNFRVYFPLVESEVVAN